MGFVLIGVPWYVGTFIFCCLTHDYRERSGLAACAIAVHEALSLAPTTSDYCCSKMLDSSKFRASSQFFQLFFPLSEFEFFWPEIFALILALAHILGSTKFESICFFSMSACFINFVSKIVIFICMLGCLRKWVCSILSQVSAGLKKERTTHVMRVLFFLGT